MPLHHRYHHSGKAISPRLFIHLILSLIPREAIPKIKKYGALHLKQQLVPSRRQEQRLLAGLRAAIKQVKGRNSGIVSLCAMPLKAHQV